MERISGSADGQVDPWFNDLTSVSHWSGFKVKMTFHGFQLFGSSLYTGQILGILCLQILDCRMYLVQFRPCICKSMYGL